MSKQQQQQDEPTIVSVSQLVLLKARSFVSLLVSKLSDMNISSPRFARIRSHSGASTEDTLFHRANSTLLPHNTSRIVRTKQLLPQTVGNWIWFTIWAHMSEWTQVCACLCASSAYLCPLSPHHFHRSFLALKIEQLSGEPLFEDTFPLALLVHLVACKQQLASWINSSRKW